MDRVELLLRAAAAANDSGEVRYAVDLARQAVARVNTRPGADALDVYGPGSSLTDCSNATISRRGCRYALGGTAAQRFMGSWSDGVPMKPLQVLGSP
jgi:hypothetical protein